MLAAVQRLGTALKRGAVRLGCFGRMLAGVAGAVAIVGGCASTGGITKDSPAEAKREVVTQRAEARWEVLIKGDLDTAYTYFSPATRGVLALDMYKAKIKPGMWRKAKVQAVKCEAEICTVDLNITYDAPVSGRGVIKGVETLITETWLIEGGTAWLVYTS